MDDQFYGWSDIRFEGTRFFRTEHQGGRWWFVTPDGNAFLTHGVNHRWERVQPMRQHSGIQDAFGSYHPIVEEMKAFSEEMYRVAVGRR